MALEQNPKEREGGSCEGIWGWDFGARQSRLQTLDLPLTGSVSPYVGLASLGLSPVICKVSGYSYSPRFRWAVGGAHGKVAGTWASQVAMRSCYFSFYLCWVIPEGRWGEEVYPVKHHTGSHALNILFNGISNTNGLPLSTRSPFLLSVNYSQFSHL